MEIRNYVLSVGRHFSQKNGRAVTELLALPLKSSKVSSKLVEGLSTESIRQITNSLPDQNFALIVCQRLSALSSLCSGDILSGMLWFDVLLFVSSFVIHHCSISTRSRSI